jgi:fatty acid desaturase
VRLEWPTLLLALAIYAGWLAATWFHKQIPWPFEAAAGGWLVAWHGSLQHEAIHGHPTPWRRVNALVAAWPLALWLPFALYRRSHLDHHTSEHLTLPGSDPETRYLALSDGWRSRVAAAAETATSTLAGRLVLGPPLEIVRFLGLEAQAVARDRGRRAVWAAHLVMVGAVLTWVLGACRMSLGEYLLAFVYPGTALSLLRSFAEHRADPDPARRIAVVEQAPLLGLLFLNNNLHVVHHHRPGEPWYRLPRLYRQARAQVLAQGGPVYAGYREVAARYLLRPHDRLVHPALQQEART